jgi:hypothetical protein
MFLVVSAVFVVVLRWEELAALITRIMQYTGMSSKLGKMKPQHRVTKFHSERK